MFIERINMDLRKEWVRSNDFSVRIFMDSEFIGLAKNKSI